MDLPAPVSPVNTLKPGLKSKETSLIRIKFLMVSFWIISILDYTLNDNFPDDFCLKSKNVCFLP
jgi:hypothetical protein